MKTGGRRGFALCALAPALLWSLLAAARAVPEPSGYWTGDMNAPVPATLQGGTVIHVAAVEALLKERGTVVIDVSNAAARPADMAPGAPWMPLPHKAIPGAIWLPGVGAGEVPASVEAWYRDRLGAATSGDLAAPVLVYCHEQCWLSWNAARRAIEAGYKRVYWFPDGIEGWTAAGRSTVVAEPLAGAPARTVLPTLAVLDLELAGDLGGPEFVAEHDARLKTESARLRRDLTASGLYELVDDGPAQAQIDRLKSQQAYLHDCNGCDLDVGRQLHADLVLVAWVDRVSGLILTLTYELHDVKTGQIAARKSYDFRGDSDNAWNHAIDYMVRDMKATSPTPNNP